MKKILAIILCAISIFSLGGCSWFEPYLPPKEIILEDGDFKYILEQAGENDVVRLLGLTEQGFKKDEITVPFEINGNHVSYVGRYRKLPDLVLGEYEKIEGMGGVYIKFYLQRNLTIATSCFRSGRYKVLFYNSRYTNLERELFYAEDDGRSSQKSVLIIPEVFDNSNYLNPLTNKIEDEYFYHTQVIMANLQYKWEVGDNTKTYWIDYVDSGNKIKNPPTPTKDGYTFNGWYKEKECINKWDFETDITKTMVIVEGQEITLEMQEREDYKTTLYAGWDKK